MLYKWHYDPSAIEANSSIKRVSQEQFFEIYQVVQTTPVHILEKQLPIEPIFLKLLPLSCALIKVVLQTSNLQEIIISDNSLRRGLFIQEWDRLKNEKLI